MKVTKSFIGKSIGLMFKNPEPLVLVFNKEQNISLHTFFMLKPIDVFFLDKDKKIVEIKRNFKPWNFYTSKKKAFFAYETPTNYLKTSLGKKVKF